MLIMYGSLADVDHIVVWQSSSSPDLSWPGHRVTGVPFPPGTCVRAPSLTPVQVNRCSQVLALLAIVLVDGSYLGGHQR